LIGRWHSQIGPAACSQAAAADNIAYKAAVAIWAVERALCGHLFVFRGRRGDLLRCFGMTGEACPCSLSAWNEASLSGLAHGRQGGDQPAQLGMLLESIDWRMPRRTWRPQLAG